MKKKMVILCIILCISLVLEAHTTFRDNTVSWLKKRNVSPEAIIVIIAMIPIIELRGAIPVGIFFFGLSWWKTFFLSLFGNMLPIPLVLLFWDWFANFIRKTSIGLRFTDWLYKRTRKHTKLLQLYKAAGLTIFVGIPLPGTGAWTGAFGAHIFGFRFWYSMWYIFLGVIIAGIAVTLLCQLGLIAFS